MKYLLDTAVFLWSMDAQDKLNPRAIKVLENRNEEIFLSPVVSWEISIKVARAKLTLSRPIGAMLHLAFIDFGMQSLLITHTHSLALGDLPPVHNDPFDRMLVAQAKSENMILMTADAVMDKYSIPIFWCGK